MTKGIALLASGAFLCLLGTSTGCGDQTINRGCGDEKGDNSPAVRITYPVTNQTLPPNKDLRVTFEIDGTDCNQDTHMLVPFMLDPSGNPVKRYGQGLVVAKFGTANIVAMAANPADLSINIPADVVTPGTKTLTLTLQYWNGQDVNPQRYGQVQVIVK